MSGSTLTRLQSVSKDHPAMLEWQCLTALDRGQWIANYLSRQASAMARQATECEIEDHHHDIDYWQSGWATELRAALHAREFNQAAGRIVDMRSALWNVVYRGGQAHNIPPARKAIRDWADTWHNIHLLSPDKDKFSIQYLGLDIVDDLWQYRCRLEARQTRRLLAQSVKDNLDTASAPRRGPRL